MCSAFIVGYRTWWKVSAWFEDFECASRRSCRPWEAFHKRVTIGGYQRCSPLEILVFNSWFILVNDATVQVGWFYHVLSRAPITRFHWRMVGLQALPIWVIQLHLTVDLNHPRVLEKPFTTNDLYTKICLVPVSFEHIWKPIFRKTSPRDWDLKQANMLCIEASGLLREQRSQLRWGKVAYPMQSNMHLESKHENIARKWGAFDLFLLAVSFCCAAGTWLCRVCPQWCSPGFLHCLGPSSWGRIYFQVTRTQKCSSRTRRIRINSSQFTSLSVWVPIFLKKVWWFLSFPTSRRCAHAASTTGTTATQGRRRSVEDAVSGCSPETTLISTVVLFVCMPATQKYPVRCHCYCAASGL